MKTIKTEIFVSLDGEDFNKLDLHSDEKFIIKYTKKDLQDITKVLAPFSKDFTLPATPKNKMSLGFFGNTDVLKITDQNELECKIYTNGVINQTGILKLVSAKYKNGKADSITANFNTSLLSLKDRIGDTKLSELNFSAEVDFTPITLKSKLAFSSTITDGVNDLKWFIPLASNKRVLTYDPVNAGEDNIAYFSGSNPKSTRVLNANEFRPAVSIVDLLGIIKSQFNFVLNTPLELKPELRDAFIWCNGGNFSKENFSKFIFKKQFTTSGDANKAVVSFADNSVKLTRNNINSRIKMYVTFKDFICGDLNDVANVTLQFVDKNTLQPFFSVDKECKNNDSGLDIEIPIGLFTANVFEFCILLKFDKPVFYNGTDVSLKFYINVSPFEVNRYSVNNQNLLENKDNQISLIRSLPDMPIIDFLNSYFQLFNMSIYDSSTTDDVLFLLTQKDIDENNKPYSKKELDYTMYADIKEVSKSVPNNFNYYNFKMADSNYKSNSDFKKQFGIDYGQTFFPLVKPFKVSEFKIESKFSIVPPIRLIGSNNWTFYGFNSSNPNFENNVFRYTPNLNEPTIFYTHYTNNSSPISVQSLNMANVLVTEKLQNYIKVMPFNRFNNFTLSYAALKINNVEYLETLFKNYYSQMIQRLLNPNALSHVFKLTLPSNELYLNNANIEAGAGNVPSGFRMQNEVIIGENKFEILEANIDQTSGETTLTLLNF